jgi:hypothetical protein
MITLSDSDIGKCYRFAYQVTLNTFERYKKRKHNITREKVIQDHFIAKLTELYLYNYLTEKAYQVTYPDFSISDDSSRYKDDIDMIVIKNNKPINLHIKVCRIDSPITKSWLIQSNTYTVTNPRDNDFFAFCTYNSPDDICIDAIVEASKVKWKEPKFKMWSKRAAYLNDLIK